MKALWALLAVLASALCAADGNSRTAPVYSYVGIDGLLTRTGTYTYDTAAFDGEVLYCVAGKKVAIQCVLHTVRDNLVLVTVARTEHDT